MPPFPNPRNVGRGRTRHRELWQKRLEATQRGGCLQMTPHGVADHIVAILLPGADVTSRVQNDPSSSRVRHLVVVAVVSSISSIFFFGEISGLVLSSAALPSELSLECYG